MTADRIVGLLAAAAALTLGACGAGAGAEAAREVSLLVTRDHGRSTVGAVGPARAPASETVMRHLQRHFDVRTRYGGGFVQAIDGLGGGRAAGRPVDWFFYVNGVEAEGGSTDTELRDGDRVWWDLHDWGAAQRIPAVVGSYPEPFAGERWRTRVECAGPGGACRKIADRLGEVGVAPSRSRLGAAGDPERLRVVVGPWAAVRRDPAARLIEEGPQLSGVFAAFSDDGAELRLLDDRGELVRRIGPGGGLIAATRWRDRPPTWFVTGTDGAGVRAAVRAFDEGTLANRFALAVQDGRAIPLPAR